MEQEKERNKCMDVYECVWVCTEGGTDDYTGWPTDCQQFQKVFIWLYTTCNSTLETNYGEYDNSGSHNTGSGPYGNGGGNGGPAPDYSGADPNNSDNIDPTKIINHPVFECVYDEFMSGSNILFNQILQPFDCAITNLIFDDIQNAQGTTCSNNINYTAGCTHLNKSNNDITIFLDLNQSPLDLASTVLHEGIHAAIMAHVHLIDVNVELEGNLTYLAELYKLYSNAAAYADHYYITHFYIEPIAIALRNIDGDKYPKEHYFPFAWDGLRPYANISGDEFLIEQSTSHEDKRITVLENTTFCIH